MSVVSPGPRAHPSPNSMIMNAGVAVPTICHPMPMRSLYKQAGLGLTMAHGVPQLPAGLGEGDLVDGKYRIGAVLGAGAMGTVVEAYHVMFADRFAIKFLKPGRTGSHPEARARFIREARAALRVDNEHVARVFDIAALDSGDLYIVMEHLEGCDLARWLEKHGPMPVEMAVDCILQACDGIAKAHALGIVHRDLKPANLFLTRKGASEATFVKVLDFGISKTTGIVPATIDSESSGGADTGTAAMMGSPYYMSPEQMESARDVDARTDIWALGVILCQLVTGRLPFDGASLVEVYRKMISASPPLPASLSTSTPSLESVVRKCIQRFPDDRYSTALELRGALIPYSSRAAAASSTASHVPNNEPRHRPTSNDASSRRLPGDASTLQSRNDVAPVVEVGAVRPRPASWARGAAVIALGICAAAAAVSVAVLSQRAHKAASESAVGSVPPQPTPRLSDSLMTQIPVSAQGAEWRPSDASANTTLAQPSATQATRRFEPDVKAGAASRRRAPAVAAAPSTVATALPTVDLPIARAQGSGSIPTPAPSDEVDELLRERK